MQEELMEMVVPKTGLKSLFFKEKPVDEARIILTKYNVRVLCKPGAIYYLSLNEKKLDENQLREVRNCVEVGVEMFNTILQGLGKNNSSFPGRAVLSFEDNRTDSFLLHHSLQGLRPMTQKGSETIKMQLKVKQDTKSSQKVMLQIFNDQLINKGYIEECICTSRDRASMSSAFKVRRS
jgi:hypothetical protein